MTTVDVCVCTFSRESLTETLRSIAELDLPENLRLRVIVADNDEFPSAKQRAQEEADRTGLDLMYVHCPARNISVARNAAMDMAQADWIAFIDDDERATKGWLRSLHAAAEATGADVILGPVRPVFIGEVPAWMRSGEFHATVPVVRGGRISQGYTANVLMLRRSPPISGQRFELSLGRSGGEDTEFFDRLISRGAKVTYAPDAEVEEDVPAHRLRLGWLIRRRFRYGQTCGFLIGRRSTSTTSRLINMWLSAAKICLCLVLLLLTTPSPRRRTLWALRAALHAGSLARQCGYKELLLYGG